MEKSKHHHYEIIQKGNSTLRNVSTPIPEDKIKSEEIKSIITAMKKAVDKQSDAVAIAAVQLAKPIRMFLISKKVFVLIDTLSKRKKPSGKSDVDKDDMVFINPKITKTSKSKNMMEEGCLSVRYVYGKVPRAEKVTVEALDENGKKFSRGFSGFLAQIVQHENDHLDGVLFVDKAKDMHEISKKEYEKMLAGK